MSKKTDPLWVIDVDQSDSFFLASLDTDVEAAWDELADSREQELLSGTAVANPIEEVIAKLDVRFPG